MQRLQKIIYYLFCGMFFLVPLVLWPYTSEIFEFNKMVLVYIFTTLITGTWIIRCIEENKFILRRTMLDIPLLIFLGSQLISTIFSIDILTSIFGYYGRFNGGLLSIICYSLLYWAFVSNLNAKQTMTTVHRLVTSAFIISVYGVLQHFGIDKHIWVQDVQSRVFSTLGQPNWLAAYLVALLPIIFNFSGKARSHFAGKLLISALFFTTLLFTKSRSGLLGFAVANLIYWGFTFVNNPKSFWKPFLIFNLSFVTLYLLIGSPLKYPQIGLETGLPAVASPQAMPAGGTESGEIRKIVWRGAIGVWRHYPIFGTGLETFAFSYYGFRPIEHNMVSEWNYVYNKAHNEYLNMAANSGTVGIISYLLLIFASIIQIIKLKRYEFLAGYVGLLVTNFFGFSVVITQLQLFLFPAIGLVLSTQYKVLSNNKKTVNSYRKILFFCVLCTVIYVLSRIATYWYSDYLYSIGKSYNSTGKADIAKNYLEKAVKNIPYQAIYHNELAISYALLAQNNEKYIKLANSEIQKAINLSPNNINIIRSQFGVYLKLSEVKPEFLINAKDALDKAILLAPNDPRLFYNLGLMYLSTGQNEQAKDIFKKAIELKSDYADPKKAIDLIQ